MHIIVVGCGRTGALLACSLVDKGHPVVVVDKDASAFWRLGSEFKGRTVEGIAFDRDVLLRAGVEKADGLAAVTSDDMVNLAVAHIARQRFHVPRVVARLFEPERSGLYEALGVPVITAASWRANHLEQLLCQPVLSIQTTLGDGKVAMVDLRVPAAWAGQPLATLYRPGRIAPAALARANSARVAESEMAMEAGDVVRLAVSAEALEELKAWLEQAGG